MSRLFVVIITDKDLLFSTTEITPQNAILDYGMIYVYIN
jgi:hypothetical protein